jgi:hypothetical protein
MPAKKYTVIYSETFMVGTHRGHLVRSMRIETADLDAWIESGEINPANIHFILDGHPEFSNW